MKFTKDQPVEYQLQSGGWAPAKALKSTTIDEKNTTARVPLLAANGVRIHALGKHVRSAAHAPSTDS